MELLNAAIHQVIKQSGSTDVMSHEAQAELEPNAMLDRVVIEARQLYKGRAAYGVFQADRELYPFQTKLGECAANGWRDFLGFTVRSLDFLMDRMRQKSAAAGGYVLSIRYRETDEEFLFVLMLNDKVGVSVTDELRLKEAIHLDLNKLYVAARVNLTRWQEEKSKPVGHKYLSFIRGRREMSDYFIDFIGGDDVIQPKDATLKVISILHDYIQTKDYQNEKKDHCRSIAADYLNGCASTGRDASIEALSNLLNAEEPNDFFDFAAADQYEMSAFFPVDKRTVGRLTGVIFNGGGLSLRMSESYVKDHVRISGDQVIISGAPADLQQEIKALL